MSGQDFEGGWRRAKLNAEAIAKHAKPPPKKVMLPEEIRGILKIAKSIDGAEGAFKAAKDKKAPRSEIDKAQTKLESAYTEWTKISRKVINAIKFTNFGIEGEENKKIVEHIRASVMVTATMMNVQAKIKRK